MNLQALMEFAVDVARQAGELIMSVYLEDDFDIQIKSDNSPVTRADLLAHHFIEEELQQYDDKIPLLSEESAFIDWQQRRNWQNYWLIDPLDGTREFMDRNDEFTVNIALINQGRPVVGIVAAPALGVVYLAAEGIGAFKSINNQPPEAIKVRAVPVIADQRIFTVVLGRRSNSKSLDTLFMKLPEYKKIILGSALKTCFIAEGKADLYPRFGNISEWDTAAAQCVLECAGGAVTNMQLSALEYNRKASLLNPDFIAWGDNSIDWQKYLPSSL